MHFQCFELKFASVGSDVSVFGGSHANVGCGENPVKKTRLFLLCQGDRGKLEKFPDCPTSLEKFSL